LLKPEFFSREFGKSLRRAYNEIGYYDTAGSAEGIFVSGNYAYVAL
jgi:hypothetical protein